MSLAALSRSQPFRAAMHMPYAAVVPMEGAPRVVMFLMASATSR